jgi:hypothetical protein
MGEKAFNPGLRTPYTVAFSADPACCVPGCGVCGTAHTEFPLRTTVR